MNLNSKKHPQLTYEKGKEIFLDPDESGLLFWFDVTDKLSEIDETIANIAAALDEVEILKKQPLLF